MIKQLKTPQAVGFIMDGNGRWAKKRGMPREAGHVAGFNATKKVVTGCIDNGIKYMYLYAFSTENWNRPKEEIDNIFQILRDYFKNDKEKLIEQGVRIVHFGDISRFPQDLQDSIKTIIEDTKHCTNLTLGICANYGGRAEIVKAVNDIIKKGVKQVDEASFSNYLYTANLPDPDLIVRTSGEHRVSGFMLYQLAYSEFYFPKIHWPQMNEKWVKRCVVEFSKRERRFGRVKK
ncbi:MAG: polyprenyl diphosphate synthase [Firmicutes bacterium]|nr:polyprenyl diphosphate synthase [Bacillota bacterium]